MIFHIFLQHKNTQAPKEMIRLKQKDMLLPHNFLIEACNSLHRKLWRPRHKRNWKRKGGISGA